MSNVHADAGAQPGRATPAEAPLGRVENAGQRPELQAVVNTRSAQAMSNVHAGARPQPGLAGRAQTAISGTDKAAQSPVFNVRPEATLADLVGTSQAGATSTFPYSERKSQTSPGPKQRVADTAGSLQRQLRGQVYSEASSTRALESPVDLAASHALPPDFAANNKAHDPLLAELSTTSVGSTTLAETSVTSSTATLGSLKPSVRSPVPSRSAAKTANVRSHPTRSSAVLSPLGSPNLSFAGVQQKETTARAMTAHPASSTSIRAMTAHPASSTGFGKPLPPNNPPPNHMYATHTGSSGGSGFFSRGDSPTRSATASHQGHVPFAEGSPPRAKRSSTAERNTPKSGLPLSRSVGSLPLTVVSDSKASPYPRSESASPTKSKQHITNYGDEALKKKGHLPMLMPDFRPGKVQKGPLGSGHTWYVGAIV
jgi:hypothetical protein